MSEKQSVPENELSVAKAKKAYDNSEFIHSAEGREIRLISEYQYPNLKLSRKGVKGTIIFFGSARVPSREKFDEELYKLKSELHSIENPAEKRQIEAQIKIHKSKEKIIEFYDDARILAKKLAEWISTLPKNNRYLICTGGGPGIMEAANRGAYEAGSPTIGLNISLPFEQNPNIYITPYYNFEFHYFFMRKFWFVSLSQAIVVFPGGFGTLDELMEVLTLTQTKKISRPLKILLYNESFWRKLINFEYLIELGFINKEDMDLFTFVNTPDEAFDILKKSLINRKQSK